MHFNRIRNQFFGCRNKVGRDSRSRFVGSDRPILHKNTHQNDQVQGNLFTSPTRKKIHGKIVDLNNADVISSNVNYSRKEALLYIFEDNEAVIKMIIKGRSPTVRHVSRTHGVALDWLIDQINLDPKIEIKYINTKNPTCRHSNQRKNSHVMNWIICCICSISVISVPFVVLKRCWKEHKKMQVKKESQQNQSRWRIWSHDTAWGIRTCLLRLHRKARWKTDLKVKYFWARGMSSNQERWDLWCALAHQTTQNGTMTTSGLLKSGTLVKRWQQERGDPWVDNSSPIDDDMDSDTATESNLSLELPSFLQRENDRLPKILDHYPKDAMQDIDKRFFGERLCLRQWKHLYSCERITQTLCIAKRQGTISRWNRCWTYLRSW